MKPILITLLTVLFFSGCARNRLLNSDCEWPPEQPSPLDLNESVQRWHLTDDARFAEDLAIRYADVHKGLHSGNYEGADEYVRARKQCMTTLFAVIANTHKVSESQAREFLTHRRTSVDIAVMLSFAALYVAGSFVIARGLWRRFPPQGGIIAGVIAILAASPVISLAGVLLGEVWSDIMEGLQVANSHMSYRADRIPWGQHRLGLFVGGVGAFWLVAVVQYLISRRAPDHGKKTTGLDLTSIDTA